MVQQEAITRLKTFTASFAIGKIKQRPQIWFKGMYYRYYDDYYDFYKNDECSKESICILKRSMFRLQLRTSTKF
jgi:hypothetical protein